MRAGRGSGLVLALMLGACRSQTAEPVDAGIAVDTSALHCETLLPGDVRDVSLPGFTLQEDRPCPTCGPVCTLHSGTEPDVRASVTYDCQTRYNGASSDTLLAPTLKAGGSEVSALGRAAARRSTVQGMLQVVAWDDDTPCAVIVTWLGGDPERALDVARLALHAATPMSIAGTPATVADLHLPSPPLDAAPSDSSGALVPSGDGGTSADAGTISSADAGTPPPPASAARPPVPAAQAGAVPTPAPVAKPPPVGVTAPAPAVGTRPPVGAAAPAPVLASPPPVGTTAPVTAVGTHPPAGATPSAADAGTHSAHPPAGPAAASPGAPVPAASAAPGASVPAATAAPGAQASAAPSAPVLPAAAPSAPAPSVHATTPATDAGTPPAHPAASPAPTTAPTPSPALPQGDAGTP